MGPAPEAVGRGRARLGRSIRPLSQARVFLAPGMKAWPRPEPAAAATFRPGGRAGAFHVPCVSQSPAGPRVQGWAARGSGNRKGEKREVGERSRGRAWPARTGSRGVGPAPSSRLAAFGLPSRGVGGFHAGPLRLTLRFQPPVAHPLSFSRCLGPRPRQPGTGACLQVPSSSPPPRTQSLRVRSSHNRPALFPFPYFFLCLAPTCFLGSPPSSGSLPSAFSACKQQLLHLGGPPPRALNVNEAVTRPTPPPPALSAPGCGLSQWTFSLSGGCV